MNVIKKEVSSFGHALRGIKSLFLTQGHARFHLLAAALSISFIIFLKGSLVEIAVILLVSALVITAEALNTALEYLTNLVSPEWNSLAGKVKDIAAGAVLISSVFAAAIGCLIILPKFF